MPTPPRAVGEGPWAESVPSFPSTVACWPAGAGTGLPGNDPKSNNCHEVLPGHTAIPTPACAPQYLLGTADVKARERRAGRPSLHFKRKKRAEETLFGPDLAGRDDGNSLIVGVMSAVSLLTAVRDKAGSLWPPNTHGASTMGEINRLRPRGLQTEPGSHTRTAEIHHGATFSSQI
ncbi:uncharacterized protein LOC143271971 isoform X2 [Peromyscus maniculatus bairdii]|uniref:uncharacterized protein LOC143271971 isoform X2 n=1 Tax=Peromyscus maniculatus bairdii TaxID=230844 RepID=UPI003FD22123